MGQLTAAFFAILIVFNASCSAATGDPNGAVDAGGADGGGVDAGPPPWGGRSIDDAYAMDQIVLMNTVHQLGYTGEFYENRAYTCGLQGFQTFLIAYPDGLPLTTLRPLWVRLHGGGVGAYDGDGLYRPIEQVSANDQESIDELGFAMRETGLVAKIRAHTAGFRFLLPSLCDHDVYSGIGIPDTNNPNSPDEKGQIRAADGLLATKAAIAFTRNRFVSSHVFLHGTSAGSIGSFGVALSFQREGVGLSGAVLDSHVASSGIIDNGYLDCMPFPYDPDLLIPKIGPLLSGDFSPEDLISSGAFKVPLYHLWNRSDPACCGSADQSYLDATGTPYSEPGCFHEHSPVHEAILANPPGGKGASLSLEICANDEGSVGANACNKHSPTKVDFATLSPPGDQLRGGTDYNQRIVDWVDLRLGDPAP